MEELYTTALSVTLERHLFTPRPFASSSALFTGGQKTSDYKSPSPSATGSACASNCPTAARSWPARWVQFVNAINGNVADGEKASLALEGSMPLLRGFGMVNSSR